MDTGLSFCCLPCPDFRGHEKMCKKMCKSGKKAHPGIRPVLGLDECCVTVIFAFLCTLLEQELSQPFVFLRFFSFGADMNRFVRAFARFLHFCMFFVCALVFRLLTWYNLKSETGRFVSAWIIMSVLAVKDGKCFDQPVNYHCFERLCAYLECLQRIW